MESSFLQHSQTGRHAWWRYLLTISAIVLTFLLMNLALKGQATRLKTLFPNDEFGKNLFTFLVIFCIFGTALAVFSFTAGKLHGVSFKNYVHTTRKFSWKLYLSGFGVYGILMFLGGLLLSDPTLKHFTERFNLSHFLILFIAGFVSIGVQSFFEEVLIRGYLLQGMHRILKGLPLLILLNATLFALLHLGYGISSLISSLSMGIVLAYLAIRQNSIAFISGVHNAHNLLLSVIFIDLSDALTEKFSWSIEWKDLGISFLILALLLLYAHTFIKKTAS
jgi:membrane protease YdiL (CAAX protease family)